MKAKQVLAGMLTSIMLVANVPVFGGGNYPMPVKAEEASAREPVRYRAVPGSSMKVESDWNCREDAKLDNIKSDAANYALSRYNTGGIPRSSQLESRNKIYIKLDNPANVSKLVWWADEDAISNGYGWNVHNGTLTRCKISVTTESVASAEAMKNLAENQWTVQEGATGDVRLDSNDDSNKNHGYCEHGNDEEHTLNVAHDIKLSDCFTDIPQNITGIRIEVLNTAGAYTGSSGDQPEKDERDTYINGRELWVMTGEGKESKLTGLTAYADFATEAGCGIEKLVDGVITKEGRMSSLTEPAAGETKENGQSPWKNNHREYFANNNIYIDIGATKTLGKLTYVPGTQNGSIKRCNIYTSNTVPSSGKMADIEDWELAYTNVPVPDQDGNIDTSRDWSEYNGSLSALGNAKEAVFNQYKNARYVRIEVINTQGSGTENKWINIGRVYIYEAEAVYTGRVENVALASSETQVAAYTGTFRDASSGQNLSPDRAINGLGNDMTQPNKNGWHYWVGTVPLRDASLNSIANNVNYMVLDLGEHTTVDLSEIQVRWQNNAWASRYRIETSVTPPGATGNVITGDTTVVTEDTLEKEGWTTVAEYPGEKENPRDRVAHKNQAAYEYPLDTFSGDELSTKELGRYVRIVINEVSQGGFYTAPGLRALEIHGIRQTGEISNLDLDLNEEPVYAGVMRRPDTPQGANYHLEDYDWYKDGMKLDKEKDSFGAGTYTLKAKVATRYELAELVEATIGGQQAVIEEGTETNSGGETVYTVSREYTIEDPSAAKQALETYLNSAEVKGAFDTNNRDESNGNKLIYRIEGWEIFRAAYVAAKSMIEMTTEGGSSDVVWYLKSEYVTAKSKLERAFNGLIRRGEGNIIETDKDMPDVTVIPPASGDSPANAKLTNPGKLENENLGLVRERDHSKPYFHVDESGYMHGRVKAPNDDEKNSLFNFSGTTKFMIKCQVKVPEQVTKKETIVGRLKGWGLQILPRGHKNNTTNDTNNPTEQLIAFAYSSDNAWPQATYNIPTEGWYGQDHDVVAVFNGGYFQLYVDGEAGEYRRTTNNEITSGPLTVNYNTSTFCVGYNENPEVSGNMEDFSGGMKDFAMYVGKDCLNDLSTLESASGQEQNKKEVFEQALTALLNGTDADVTLTGEPTKYDVSRTVWELVEDGETTALPGGSAFERYRDYKVTIDIRTTEGDRFDKQQAILRTGEGDDAVLAHEIVPTEEEVLIRLSYIFRGEKHPKETLTEYLAGLADELEIRVENDSLVNKDKTTGTKKYTTAGWNEFVPIYNAAVEQAEQDKAWGAENNADRFSNALTDLQEAVRVLKTKTANGQCECVLGTITFTGENIALDEASAEITLNAACTIDNTNCIRHTGDAKAEAVITYTCDEENEAGASIQGDKLTVTQEGSVTVTARVQLVDEGTTAAEGTAEAVFTAASTPADAGDQEGLNTAIGAIESAISKLKQSDYTPESWQALLSKLQEAKDMLSDLAAMLEGTSDKTVNKNQVAGMIEDLDVNKILVKKEDKTAQAKENLQKAIRAADAVFAAGSKDYTDAAWKAFEEAYKAAKAAPANADANTLKKLTDALVSAQAGLNKPVVLGDTKTTGGMQYRVTNAGSRAVMLIKGKDVKNITIPAAITIKGASYKVTAVGDQAFANKGKIQKLTIGINVTKIGKKAFMKCKKLKNVIFKGAKVKTVKNKAFKSTGSKVKVKFSKKLKGKQRTQLIKKLKKAGMKIK